MDRLDRCETLAVPLEDLPGPVCLLADERVVAHNAKFAQWVGRSDLVGMPISQLFSDDPVLARLSAEALSTGAPVDHHLARRTPGGESSFWTIRAQQTPRGVLIWADDVTPIAGAAQAVHAAQRDYVAVAAHELRAPLAAIKAWASVVDSHQRGVSNETVVSDALRTIARQVDRMDELMTDLLDVARSDAGALHPDRTPIGVNDLAVRVIAASPYAAQVSFVADEQAGRVTVDPLHVEIAMGRLLAYVGRRQPEVPVAMDIERPSADEIHLVVVDAGPALAPHAHADLFGRAFRGGRRQGPGLGLHVAQLLLVASGGRVWREARGSEERFVVALPVEVASAKEPPRDLARVVVGERDPALCSRIVSVLRLQGHDVVAAPSGELVRTTLEAGPSDALLLDACLLGGDLSAIARFRAAPGAPAVVVVGPVEERGAAERAGALAVLPRPLDLPHLLALIQSALVART